MQRLACSPELGLGLSEASRSTGACSSSVMEGREPLEDVDSVDSLFAKDTRFAVERALGLGAERSLSRAAHCVGGVEGLARGSSKASPNSQAGTCTQLRAPRVLAFPLPFISMLSRKRYFTSQRHS